MASPCTTLFLYDIHGGVYVVAHDNRWLTHHVMMSQWKGNPLCTMDPLT